MNIIHDAMDLLKEHGWTKGTCQNVRGQLCVGGAIAVAVGHHPGLWQGVEFTSAMDMVGEVAHEQYPERSHLYPVQVPNNWAVSFNNHPETTEEELFRVCEKAAIRLDEVV